MTTRKIILHIGGPKCGSSALQAALSATPKLRSTKGRDLSYVGLRPKGEAWQRLQGRAVRIAADRSVHGYVSWPNLHRHSDQSPIFAALDGVWETAHRGPIPVLSNEGWIGQAGAFQHHLPHWFQPGDAPEIVLQSYARPPIEWLNSAFWQWGVWNRRSFGKWLQNNAVTYRLGAAFTEWNALPNTRLNLHLSGDVVDHFSADHGVILRKPDTRNTSQSPAMVGFMLRNRRFRKTSHDSATEFVFQRWCDLPDAPRLWAVAPRHVQQLRVQLREDVKRLIDLLPEDQQRKVRQTDRRWTSNEYYYNRIRQGPSKLDNPEQLASLYSAICKGVERAAQDAKTKTPPLTTAPALATGIEVWDAAVAKALDHLIDLDKSIRKSHWRAVWRNLL